MHSFGLTLARLVAIAAVRAGMVLAGCAVAAAAAGVAWGAQDVVLTMAQPASPLSIDGSVSGVVAGGPKAALVLTLHNGNDSARDVTRVTADPTGVVRGPAACHDSGYLSAGEWSGAISVPANGTARVRIPVSVSAELPHECVDVTWELSYAAY